MKIVGLVLLLLVAVWLLGGVILRFGGLFVIFLVLFGLTSGAVEDAPASAPFAAVWLLAGVLMWLAGHWHFALRHGQPKSTLADAVFASLPRWLDPLHRRRPASAGSAGRLAEGAHDPPKPLPLLEDQLKHGVNARVCYRVDEEPRRDTWRPAPQGSPGPWRRRPGGH